MESYSTLAKRPRFSIEESLVDQSKQEEMEEARSDNRRMCNELVHELYKEIPAVKTSDRILLTSHNMYAYLFPIFRKKLTFRNAINNCHRPTSHLWWWVVEHKIKTNSLIFLLKQISQEQSDYEFELKTNHFHVQILDLDYSSSRINIRDNDAQFECAHMHYFLFYLLRSIAPLVQPIHLYCCSSNKPIEYFMHFLSAHSDIIVLIALSSEQFNSAAIEEWEALGKWNKLEISLRRSVPVNMSKLIQWLTTNNNNGPPKKCLSLRPPSTDVPLFLDEIKKDFAHATGKCRFVVRMELEDEQLAEFTLCNECTGERLQLRRIGANDKPAAVIYALSRCPSNELDANIEDNWREYAYHVNWILFR